MDSALAWVGQIAEWIGRFIPRWEIINTTQSGIKWVKGKDVVTLPPGVHWYWPATTELIVHPVARQAIDLRPQTLETKDGITILAGGLVSYEIEDIEMLLAHTYDPDNTVRDICLPAIHDVLHAMTWEEITTAPRLSLRLKNEVQRELKDYGVKVLQAKLTDLAKCPVLRLINSTNMDGI